jgi:hypothetical protein
LLQSSGETQNHYKTPGTLKIPAGSVAAPGLSSAQSASQKVALYANVGPDLMHYDVDVEARS